MGRWALRLPTTAHDFSRTEISGVWAYTPNMVTLDAIEAYRRERLGQRGGYRPGAGRRTRPTDETATTASAEDLSAGGQDR
jgi:hypothetical protein